MRDRTRYEKVESRDGFKWLTLGSGRRVTFIDAVSAAESAESELVRWMSRVFKLAGGSGFEGFDWQMIEHLTGRLEDLVRAYRQAIEEEKRAGGVRERVAQLRDVSGRTPEEAALYLAKADQLEAEEAARGSG